MKRRSLTMNSVLIMSLIGAVTVVLLTAMLLFLRLYQNSLIRNAQTNSRRTISQVSDTVNSYLSDIDRMKDVIDSSLMDPDLDRDEFFDVFLRIMPDTVAVSTYSSSGLLKNCYSLVGDVRSSVGTNLSFDRDRLSEYENGYISAPHVCSLFENSYPWVVTMISPLDMSGSENWLALDISCSNISEYINGVGVGQRGYCFLMDSDGNIVYHPQQQLIYSELKTENTEYIASLEDGIWQNGNIV